MGCHIYIYDKQNREVPAPSVRISMEHEGKCFTLHLDAHRFVEDLRKELKCSDLTLERKVHVLEAAWRGEGVSSKDRDMIDLDWIVELINRPDFGKLLCG